MKPDAMAALHRAAFAKERPWSAAEFSEVLTSPLVTLHTQEGGFALTRNVVDESELLTLAVDPARQRRGIGDALMTRWLSTSGATLAFLEVAADNAAALALYHRHGFTQTGLRRAYYKRQNAANVDAVVMTRR